MPKDGGRRAEILDAASALFAASGLRTTVNEIADACGILAGSLYYHFDSKDAIIVALVRRYQTELDGIAEAAVDRLHKPGTAVDAIVELGNAIAACAVHHRAALLLTIYDPPTSASDELVALARRTPTAIQAALLDLLRTARDQGELRPGPDLELLSERLCHSMLHVGIGVTHRAAGVARMATIRCRILLDGVATTPQSDDHLDHSPAFLAAEHVIASWAEHPAAADSSRAALVRATARSEFGRRGYEATTMRDIAGAAGIDVRSVYRVVESKEHLLASIMQAYAAATTAGWNAVHRSASTPVEKIDALLWYDINILGRFNEEFRIQLAGLRQAPPDSPDLAWTFPSQLRQVRSLVTAGARAGNLHLHGGSVDLRARCLFELLWTPEQILRAAGSRGVLALGRDTLIRGATTRPAADRQARRTAQID